MLKTPERLLPKAIAPALGLSPFICKRCFIGSVLDGDCSTCAQLDYAGALELRLLAIANRLGDGRLAQVQALLEFCVRTLPVMKK